VNIFKVERILNGKEEVRHYNVYFKFDSGLMTCDSYNFEYDSYQNPGDDVKFEIVGIKPFKTESSDRKSWKIDVKVDSPYFPIIGVVFMAKLQNRTGIDASPGFLMKKNQWAHIATQIFDPEAKISQEPMFNVVAFIKKNDKIVRYQMRDNGKQWEYVK